jgi:hypothetical protein
MGTHVSHVAHKDRQRRKMDSMIIRHMHEDLANRPLIPVRHPMMKIVNQSALREIVTSRPKA